ncbi:hypothetical protein M514_08546 [Trichuris suis]|uniref:Eukaryotic translation initiation factor 3 subunit I n=1 Tax=Trichuris suis TaxID=68888 RepID=A0A085NDZ5_9BILA|nr:hypothetical protein M513_08546 [Trichuris suis]KFD67691.1 hypothetical protein M514_08546 [Trichuris suis]
MKPLVLRSHERPITKVKYNREGDLLFSCSKDSTPIAWFPDSGEILGFYKGHNGVVWSIDVSWDSKLLVTGGGDNRCFLWNVEDGKILQQLDSPTGVRTVGISFSGNLFFVGNDSGTSNSATLKIFDIRDRLTGVGLAQGKPALCYDMETKMSCGLWARYDDIIVTGSDKGDVVMFDLRMESGPSQSVKEHKREVMDLCMTKDQAFIASASKDCSAKLFDARSLTVLKTYKAEKPVNSVAISPIRDHVVLGGGLEAMSVTTTDTRQGQFEAKFYHMIFEDEFARLPGHFGPINSMAFHPSGCILATGGEDGNIRINELEVEYFDFDFDY